MTKTVNRLAAFALVLFTITLAPFAKASEWDKKTVITIHEPIQIQGKVLASGQYVMKLLDSPSNRSTLQVYNADRTMLEMTILAIPAYRLEPTGDTRLTFFETQQGQPRALRTWFYPGDNSGLEFPLSR